MVISKTKYFLFLNLDFHAFKWCQHIKYWGTRYKIFIEKFFDMVKIRKF